MFDIPSAMVYYVSQNEYEVFFAIKKPYAKTSELVKANSSLLARKIVEAKYGKENITIFSVKEIEK